MQRFNHDAENQEELKNYIKNRALQLLSENVSLLKYEETFFGAIIYWNYNDEIWNSVFLYPEFRGQGLYLKTIKDKNLRIITVPDCNIEDFLKKKKVDHVVVNHFLNTEEYKLISNYYLNNKAKRSNQYLMNHIDEGLAILSWIEASESTKKAYCLHPILQSNEDLSLNYLKNFKNIDQTALILAMEYRHIANDYLSTRTISGLDDIKLSPLKEVQEMLIADKIQNYKDFLIYHKNSHPRSSELDLYFQNWLNKLKISDLFQKYSKKLEVNLIEANK